MSLFCIYLVLGYQPALETQPLYRIGGPESNHSFHKIEGPAITDEGHVYIADPRAGNISHFDEKGHFAGSLGRRGQGPGEFTLPMSVLAHGDQLYVSDPFKGAILVFDRSGKHRHNLRSRLMSLVSADARGRLTGLEEQPGQGFISAMRLARFDPAGGRTTQLVAFTTPALQGDWEPPADGNIFSQADVAPRREIYAVPGGLAVLTSRYRYEIFLFDGDGRLRHTIKRAFVNMPYRPEEHAKPKIMGMGDMNTSGLKIKTPELEQDIVTIVATAKGFWAVTSHVDKHGNRIIHDYDRDGGETGELRFDNRYGMPIAHTAGNIWSVRYDAEEEQSYLYRLAVDGR